MVFRELEFLDTNKLIYLVLYDFFLVQKTFELVDEIVFGGVVLFIINLYYFLIRKFTR